MYVPFENLPDESKIWIYPSNRKFSEEEVAEIETALMGFVEEWASHGSALEASFQIPYNRFIILAINHKNDTVCGGAIDSSVHFIQSLEQKYGVDLLDRMNVTYKLGEHIAHKSLLDFKKMAKDRAVTANTIVFNNLVNTVGEYRELWEVPAIDSWHSRFF